MEPMPLIQKIEADARDAAAQLLAAAREKAQAVAQQSDQDILTLHEQTAQRIKTDTRDMAQRMQRMGDLEDRKALLANKRLVMDEAFTQAIAQLKATPPDKARAFFLSRMVDAARGDETVLPGTLGGGVDEDLVREANAQLAAQGKPGRLTLSSQRVPGFGFAMNRDGIEIVCTFERLVHDARMSLETEVAAVLFPAQGNR